MGKTRQSSPSLRSDAAQVLATDAGWHARLAARRISAALDTALAASELTSSQFGLMCLVASAPDDTLGGLALRAGLNQFTMSRNVDQLAAAGLVEVALVEADRRRRAVWLTERGARRLVAALPLARAAHQTLAASLGPGPARQFADAARKLGAQQDPSR